MLKGSNKTDYQRDYMRKKRAKKSTKNIEVSTPAIVKALTDPKKRAMLKFISEDLKRKHLGDQLRYGVFGPTFEVIAELLEVTA